MPAWDHEVVPVAVPLPPALLVHVTEVKLPEPAAAVPLRVSGVVVVLNVGEPVGTVIAMVGGVAPVSVTVRVAEPCEPSESWTVAVITLEPGWSTIPDADQLVVPTAVPEPPALFDHVTAVSPPVPDVAVPPRVSGVVAVEKVGELVGIVIAMVGGVPPPAPEANSRSSGAIR